MATLRAYKVGSMWQVDIPGTGRNFDVMEVDPGTGAVRDVSGAKLYGSDVSLSIVALRQAGAGHVADRVMMWKRTRDFG